MSAPLVINLRDGSVWERRAMTAAGVALYALAGSCNCPEYLMASESELAAQGIAGSADVLPMPVGPRTLDVVEEELTGASLSLWEEERGSARLRLALALASAQRGRRELRSQVAELKAERHSTNEALDDAVKALRARREDEPVEPYVSRLLPPRDAVCARPGCGHRGEDHHHGDTKCWANLPRTRQPNGAWGAVQICYCEGFVAAPAVEVSADRLTAFFAPTQALREGGA